MIPATFGPFCRVLDDRRAISCHWSIAQSAGSWTNSDDALATVRPSPVMFGAPEPQSMSCRYRTESGSLTDFV